MENKSSSSGKAQGILKSVSFSLMGLMIVLLVVSSIVEKFEGADFAVKYFYTAPWTIALWAVTILTALAYMFTQRVYKQLMTCLLHFSFVIILGGAMLTHLTGESGEIHLREDGTTELRSIVLPFEVKLTDFSIDYYPGTSAPMDFVSYIEILPDHEAGRVSMNNVFKYKHYRFYQSMYDDDGHGVTLRVSHDPWGIGVTYLGYALLLISMLLFFFQRRTHFRALLRSPLLRAVVLPLVLLCSMSSQAQTAMPPTVPQSFADAMCNLYVNYNDRVCPLQTMAKDLTVKLYGKSSYKGLSAEQVLCGWLFYYDQWAQEPIIKQKGDDVRLLLGGKYVSLNDYVSGGKYKLESMLRQGNKNARRADEKFRLVSMVATGTLLTIYPIVDKEDRVSWYSWVSPLPDSLAFADFQFIKGSMEYVWLSVAKNDYASAIDALQRIRLWQINKATAAHLPSDARFKAEKIYNKFDYTKPMAMALTTMGLLLFIALCVVMSRGKRPRRPLVAVFTIIMLPAFLVLTAGIGLRWVVSGHVPLSNGFETMQFLSWVSALITLIAGVRCMLRERGVSSMLVIPMGYLLSGLTLMVSMMSASNPQVTNLMPVLQSPLLTVHVAIIMVAYCLLFFIMMNGLTAILIQTMSKQPDERKQMQIERLKVVSQILLYPAVFCLTIGIFIGAVWANQSWGRYWGWDPKEVWALITMMVYAMLLHTGSLKNLNKPMVFHVYSVIAFLAVLFTYFGVNFLLGGMHAYN